MASRLFVVETWSREVEDHKNMMQTLPIWVEVSKTQKEMWTVNGIGYTASLIGEPKCTDDATTKKKRLEFAKLCVHIYLYLSPFQIPYP
ncbi:hypothetical protein IFM89_000587 [Coptis chinensis]|uniref:DUF4283 domain-containing protein n=1 Tax=Coptis chinensis TaxID=261450 RepID=A0A835HA13_9MAGN|nr:hypothetical protein IFM89_000587 [Coptis chinensis]